MNEYFVCGEQIKALCNSAYFYNRIFYKSDIRQEPLAYPSSKTTFLASFAMALMSAISKVIRGEPALKISVVSVRTVSIDGVMKN